MPVDKILNNGINMVSSCIQKQRQKTVRAANNVINSTIKGLEALATYNKVQFTKNRTKSIDKITQDVIQDGLTITECVTKKMQSSPNFRQRAEKCNKILKDLQDGFQKGLYTKEEYKKAILSAYMEFSNNSKFKSEIIDNDNYDINKLWAFFQANRDKNILDFLNDDDNIDLFKRITKLGNEKINPFECIADYAGFDKQSGTIYKQVLTLVEEKKLDPGILKGWRESNFSQDFIKNIKLYNYAKKMNLSAQETKRLFIPELKNLKSDLRNIESGSLFEYNNALYLKLNDNTISKQKISCETYMKLFSPVGFNSQGISSDCYLLSAINSMMDTPTGKAKILSCFEEVENNKLKIQLPDGKISIITDLSGELPSDKLQNSARYSDGDNGIKLLEAVYEDEICARRTKMIINAIDEKMVQKTLNESQIQKYTEILDSLKSGKNNYVIIENPKGLNPLLEISAKDSGYYGKTVYLVDISELKNKPQYFSENPEIFYRSNIGNIIEAFNTLGCSSIIAQNKPLIQKLSMDNNGALLNFITTNKDNYLFGVSTKFDPNQSIEVPLNFEKGLLASHAYSLKIKENPTNGKMEYILTNPYNSIREIVLTEGEMQKYIRSVGIVKK